MKNSSDHNYKVFHCQKILIGSSNKFSAGYLIVKGSIIETFIPEIAGKQALTQQQRESIIELQPHLYILPSIIDTNTSINLDPYDKEWQDNTHLTMLNLKYGVTTVINQSLLQAKQQQENRFCDYSNHASDLKARDNEINSLQENLNQRKKESIKLIYEKEKLAEQNQMQNITKTQPSQIFSDENEQKHVEQIDNLSRGNSKISMLHIQSKADQQKGGSLADILSEEREKQGYCSGVEPSTNSRTPSCILDNQTKNPLKLKYNCQDPVIDLFCDCINISIPESTQILTKQMGKKTAQCPEIHTNLIDSEQKKSSDSLDNDFNQDLQSHSLRRTKKPYKQQDNMIKLYTSPPFLPEIPYFTKHENISSYIAGICDKLQVIGNKKGEDYSSDSSSSQLSENDNEVYVREQGKLNNVIVSPTDLQTSQEEDKQKPIVNLFDIEQKQDNYLNPFNYVDQSNQNENVDESRSQTQLLNIANKTYSEKFIYNNHLQLSIIPEIHSQQTEQTINTHSEITESRSRSSNFILSSGSQQSQSIRFVQFCSLNSNQQSITIQEQDGEESDLFKRGNIDLCQSQLASQQVIFSNKPSQIQHLEEEDSFKESNENLSQNLQEQNQQVGDGQSEVENNQQQQTKVKENGQGRVQMKNLNDNYQYLSYDQRSYQQDSNQLDLHRILDKVHNQEEQREEKKVKEKQIEEQNYSEKINESEEEDSDSNSNVDDIICNLSIQNENLKQNMEECNDDDNKEAEEEKLKILKKKEKKQSKRKQKVHPIFFIHPSSQQGDNNLSLSSPFRQQQFSERIINKNPPKLGGDALRAPFEKDYEETMNDLRQIDPDSEDYNQEIKQLLQEVFEASKENSKSYTDHLINHSQLSDYNNDLMDESDKNEEYEFNLGKQSLKWPQPPYELNFDKEKNYFNNECNNYQPERSIYLHQNDSDIENFNLADSQYFGNDEVRESQQNIHQSVIQFDEGETEKTQIGTDTITSLKDTLYGKSLKLTNFGRPSDIFVESRKSSLQSNNLIVSQKNENSSSVLAFQNDDNINKEASPKEDNTQGQILDQNYKFEIRNKGSEQIFNNSARLREQLSPIQIVRYDADSSNEGGKNNEPQEKKDPLNSWKNSPLFIQNPNIFTNQERQNSLDQNKELSQIKCKELNKRISSFEGIGVKKANSICESSEDLEDSNCSNNKQNIQVQLGDQEKNNGVPKQKNNLFYSSELLNSIDRIENEESKLEVQTKQIEGKNDSLFTIKPLQIPRLNKDESQLQSPKQQEEVCISQVKRPNFALLKLDKPLSQFDIPIKHQLSHQMSENYSNVNLFRGDSQREGFNLSQTVINLSQKGEDSLVKSSMSLMERRQKSCQIQSINLDLQKQTIKPLIITNNPKADYLHFLSVRPFFWEYYALQMYCQILRSLVLIIDHGMLNQQLSRSLTSSPVTNHLLIYQQGLNNSQEDGIRSRSRTHSTAQPFNPVIVNTSAWKERLSTFSSNRNSPKNRRKTTKKGNQIATFIFQNISNGLSIVRIFSMRKTFEDFVHIYTEVSWPFLFFDSTQISPGDTRFKIEPAIQNQQNKQILQSCLFKNPNLINMVGSFHLAVPPKYKFFSQLQNMINSQQVQSFQNMTQQVDQFPGDFQRAINGLFSLGGQLPSLWTIAMAQNSPIKPIQVVRTPLARSKSQSFSFGGISTKNLGPLPTIISNPSIFKQMQDDESDQQQDSSSNPEQDSSRENNPSLQNRNQQQQQYIYEGKPKRKSTFYQLEKNDHNLNDCIKNIIQQNEKDNQTASENQSPVSHLVEDFNTEINHDQGFNQILTEEIQSQKTNSNDSSPKGNSQQNNEHEQQKMYLNEQEEKNLIRIVDVLSRNPAKICNLKNKGSLDEGKHADFIIFDPFQVYEFSAFVDEKQKFPQYLHILNSQKVQGKVISTYLRGQKLYEDSKFFLDDFTLCDEV